MTVHDTSTTVDKSDGARSRRSVASVEWDMERVARMDRRGYSVTQISEALSLSIPKVQYYLRKLRERYIKAQQEEMRVKVEEKRSQLKEVRKEAWQAWEKSKKDRVQTVNEESTSTSGRTGHRASEKTVTTIEGRLPDAVYLNTILSTLKQEGELDGLDAPKKVAAQVVTINWADMMDWRGSSKLSQPTPLLRERVQDGGGQAVPLVGSNEVDVIEAEIRAVEEALGDGK